MNEVPPVLELSQDGQPEMHQTECLGRYVLEEGREVNGRPVWKKVDDNRYLAKSGSDWMVQDSLRLGTNSGWLHLVDDAPLPYLTNAVWKECYGNNWSEVPTLKLWPIDEMRDAEMRAAVAKTGRVLKYASDELREDHEVVLSA
eukprot:1293376-Prymnesium_polylepis.1